MTVSVLGLGAMGARVATRLVDAGHAVTVWNRSAGPADALAARGAAVAPTPAAAAAASEIVLAMVRDDEASEAVWEGGALGGLRPGALAVEMSTLTPARARTLVAAVAARGARFVDAPVVGTRPHAEAGQLTVLAGGDEAAIEAARPVWDAVAGAVRHTGAVGTGMAAKLAVNALFAVQAVALAELLRTLAAEGMAPADAAVMFAAMPTASPAATRLAALMTDGVTAPNFPVALVAKDLAYVRHLCAAASVESRVVAAAGRAFDDAEAAGLGGLDIAGIAALYG